MFFALLLKAFLAWRWGYTLARTETLHHLVGPITTGTRILLGGKGGERAEHTAFFDLLFHFSIQSLYISKKVLDSIFFASKYISMKQKMRHLSLNICILCRHTFKLSRKPLFFIYGVITLPISD